MSEASVFPTPWQFPWPADQLESVPHCPVCGSDAREVLQRDLIDNVFFVARGRWTLHRCIPCQSAYLDPRPNETSIGDAYGNYYTHRGGAERVADVDLHGFLRLRRALANGYLNYRYSTNYRPASALGILVAYLLPQQRQALDVQFRYLPKAEQGKRLLDVGCGNGDFLVSASRAGWNVLGLDPDEKAVATAQRRGVDVRVGMITDLNELPGTFDVITLSHVIEHVHRPKAVLASAHRLLKAGGILYLDTPNIDSRGAKRFGRNWRGLETPRHLVLFNPDSLQKLLTEIGFHYILPKRRIAVTPWMYLTSLRMCQGKSPYDPSLATLSAFERLKIKLRIPRLATSEFITLTALKK